MSKENVAKSIQVYSIALIAPFLVWVLLRVVAAQNPPSHDPNPWIQSMVQSPAALTVSAPKTRWVPVLGKDGELFIDLPGNQHPLSDFADDAEKFVFVVHAQGPTIAKKFYDFIVEKNLKDRSLILSSSDGFLKDLRFYDGNLTMGCGQAYIVRWRALKQIGLEHMMTITMSGVWLDPQIFASSLDTLTEEFTKLQVPVFIGPVTAEEAKNLPTQANILIK
jgi:hypothetical protein